MQKILLSLLACLVMVSLTPLASAEPVVDARICVGHVACFDGGPCANYDTHGGAAPHAGASTDGVDVYMPTSDFGGMHFSVGTSCAHVGP